VVEAGHPIPSPAALAAGARVLALAEEAREDDLVVVLLSGGGSALLDALPQGEDGITLADLQMLTAALLACGATIGEINCLRKHLSLLKGGQLARAVYPARLLTLVLSDVVGSPLDVIASGPTVPDPTTWADAWGIVQRYGLAARLPRSIARRLREGVAGMLQETPKPGDPLFAAAHTVIVGDNRVAALAAVRAAQRLGYNSLLLSTYVEGEAAQVARVVAALAREVVASRNPLAAPACLVLGGETTVTLTPPAGGNGRNGGDSSKVGEPGKDGGPGMAGDSGRDRGPGKGGRNQELALAAAVALAGVPRVTVGCLATDGSDGPTDSAGAIVDGGTVARGRALDREAADALLGHDAYFFLEATADLLRCGPTLTNVNDLIVLLIDGP
jgi:hydroxypyruvate reductase